MEKRERKMHLPSLDDYFTTQEERETANLEKNINVNITDIDDFPEHPFKVNVNDEMNEMVASIRENGVLVPAIVRQKENGKLTFNDLYLGKYVLKETKTLTNYILDSKEYFIELTEIDNKTAVVSKSLKLSNQLMKGTLEFTKTDLVNGEVIPNTLIVQKKVYNI